MKAFLRTQVVFSFQKAFVVCHICALNSILELLLRKFSTLVVLLLAKEKQENWLLTCNGESYTYLETAAAL